MIHIIDDYYMDADKNCFMLHRWNGKTTTDKNGRENKANVQTMYYSTFDDFLTGVNKHMTRQAVSDSKTLDEISGKLDVIQDIITAIGKSLVPSERG